MCARAGVTLHRLHGTTFGRTTNMRLGKHRRSSGRLRKSRVFSRIYVITKDRLLTTLIKKQSIVPVVHELVFRFKILEARMYVQVFVGVLLLLFISI